MLDKKTKQKLINKFKTHENDTGSPQVQIAVLTEEIKQLADHLKQHKHDHSSRRGLLKMVGDRRRLIRYLMREDQEALKVLAQKLNLKIAKKLIEEDELAKAQKAKLDEEPKEGDLEE